MRSKNRQHVKFVVFSGLVVAFYFFMLDPGGFFLFAPIIAVADMMILLIMLIRPTPEGFT